MFDALLSILFPNNCSACEQPMARGESVICTTCLAGLPYTDYDTAKQNAVEKMFWGRAPLEAGMALFYFNKGNRVQRLMHALKYQKDTEVGLTIGRLAGARLTNNPRFRNIDRVVPVPLHPKKHKRRGFNQSELIARGISEVTGIPLDTETLVREVNNPTQTRRSRYDRFRNVSGAFALKDFDPVTGRHILLVDDVVTTGSTLESCITAYQKAGKTTVSVCVAACAE